MRHSPETYAEAFLEALETKPSDEAGLVKRLLGLAMKNGDASALPKILKAIQAKFVKKNKGRMIVVEVARKLSPELMQSLTKTFRSEDNVEVIQNPALIAGMRVTIDGEWMVDSSFEAKLKKLFI